MNAVLHHFSEQPLAFDLSREYDQNISRMLLKPQGFWLSDELDHGWKSWCENEEWNIGGLRHRKTFRCDLSRWAVLRDANSVRAFSARFSKGVYERMTLDWHAVASEFAGILISPYQWELRHDPEVSWYYGWDCASACVWDLSTVEELP